MLILNVAERVGSLQGPSGGVKGGFRVFIGLTNEVGWRARAGIIVLSGDLLNLELGLCVKLITVWMRVRTEEFTVS